MMNAGRICALLIVAALPVLHGAGAAWAQQEPCRFLLDNCGPEGRAPPPPAPARPPAPSPSSTRAKPWNAIAAAIWKVDGKVHVAVGYSGTRPTQEQARASAAEACRNAGGQDCQVKGAWNFGCVYITTGSTSQRAGWGSGSTTAEASKRCRDQGLTCKEPIGGCVE